MVFSHPGLYTTHLIISATCMCVWRCCCDKPTAHAKCFKSELMLTRRATASV